MSSTRHLGDVNETELRRKVEELLMKKLGFSDSILVEFLIDCCRSCSLKVTPNTPSSSSSGHLIAKLQDSGLLDDALQVDESCDFSWHDFASQLYEIVVGNDHKNVPSAQYDNELVASIRKQQKRKQYAIIDYDYNEYVEEKITQNTHLTEPKAKSDQTRRQFRKSSNQNDENESDTNYYQKDTGLRESSMIAQNIDDSLTINDDSNDLSQENNNNDDEFCNEDQLEINADQEELKNFTKRLLDKDRKKTKLFDEPISSKVTKETLEEETNKQKLEINEMREKSRQIYLKKRQKDKLDDVEEELKDEREIFMPFSKLSEGEMKKIEIKQKVLDLAKEYKSSNIDQQINRYFVPDDSTKLIDNFDEKKFFLSKKTQNETIDQGFDSFNEQKAWEDDHMAKASMKIGAQHSNDSRNDMKMQNKYKMIFSDEIEFIESLKMPGTFDAPQNDNKNQIDHNKKLLVDIEETRKSLPIFAYRDQLLDAIKHHQILIIEGETGSGKTTQIAQYLFESAYCKDNKRIGITQPRRVAAMSVASRVAKEMNVKLGHEVGYCIRFEDCTSERTLLRFMTDGMLLREFLLEPYLSSYSVIIIDEAHERSISTDILLGLIKDLARFREDLKVIIASATLDTDKFSAFFDDAPVFKVPGRRYPVDIFYTAAPEADYVESMIVTILQIHLTQPDGDILAFLSGQDEIEYCVEQLNERCKKLGSQIKPLRILPLFSSLPSDLQAKIFAPCPENMRKVVVSTNIAETSLTIDGIKYVIDSGFCKQKSFDPRSRLELLTVVPLSKASADQRAGRAGRTGPGKCFRLFTAWAYHNELEDVQTPEIQRTNLSNVLLMLKSLGIDDLLNFDFLDPPPHQAMIHALEQLYALGALNHLGQLTKLGRQMAEFPCDPSMSKSIIAASHDKFDCIQEVLTICAMLSVTHSIFYRPSAKDKQVHADAMRKSLASDFGDHITLLEIYNQWHESGYSKSWCYDHFIQYMALKSARDIRDQLLSLAERTECVGTHKTNDDHVQITQSEIGILNESKTINNNDSKLINVRKALTSGFFFNAALLVKSKHSFDAPKGLYRTLKHRQTVKIHPSSCLFDRVAPNSKLQSKLRNSNKNNRIDNGDDDNTQELGDPPQWVIFHELVYTTAEYMRQVMQIDGKWLLEVAPHYYQQKELFDSSETSIAARSHFANSNDRSEKMTSNSRSLSFVSMSESVSIGRKSLSNNLR